jgi:hypothetical protein
MRSIETRQWSFHVNRPLYLATGASIAVATCNRTVVHPLPETFLAGGWLQGCLLCYLQPFQVGGRPRRGVLAHTLVEPRGGAPPAPGASVAVAVCDRTVVHPLPETFLTGGWLEGCFLYYLQGFQVG